MFLAALGLALGLGGAHPAVPVFFAPLLAIGTWFLRPELAKHGVPFAAWVALALGGYTLLGTVPLPLAWLELLSPNAADIWSRSLLPVGERPHFASLSLDPGASALEALKWALYACGFVAAAAIRRRFGRLACVGIVFALSGVTACAAVVHAILGATRVFGLYDPRAPIASIHVGPLLNPNTLAGYLNLGGFCGLGLSMSRRLAPQRVWLAAGTALIFAVAILSGSRAGVGLIPVGVVALLALLRLPDATGERAPRRGVRDAVLVAAILVVGAILAALAGRSTMLLELLERDLKKLEVIPAGLRMVLDFPVFGAGRGAFESVFSAYKFGSENQVFSHPENLPIQWLSEWGIPVGLVAFAAFGWAFRFRRLQVSGTSVGAGAAAGVLVLVLQNLVDLSLELPAVALASCFALTGLLAPGRHAGAAPLLLRRGLPLAFAGVWAAALWFGQRPVARERDEIARLSSALVATDRDAVRAFRERLVAAMRRHPADPYFARTGGYVALRAGDVDPMPWVQRALERGETSSRSHLLAALVLARRGATGQALFELGLAVRFDARLAAEAGKLAASWTRSCDALKRVSLDAASAAVFLTTAAGHWIRDEEGQSRRACLEAAIGRAPGHVFARRALGEQLMQLLERGSCPEQAECARVALEQARALQKLEPWSASGVDLEARVLHRRGERTEALRLLREKCPALAGRERIACLNRRFTLSRENAGESRAELLSAASDLIDAACLAEHPCDKFLIELGDRLGALDEWIHALSAYQRAVRENANGHTLLRLGTALAKLGRGALAEDALLRASRVAGGDPVLQERIQRARDGVARSRLGRAVDSQ